MKFAAWLEGALPGRWREAVWARRALDGEGYGVALHEATLAKVGKELGVTRERARQILERAREALSGEAAQRAADGLYGVARAALEAAGGAMMPGEWTAAAGGNPLWDGVSPTGALLVLHDAAPGRIGLHRGVFTVLGEEQADAVDGRLRDALRRAGAAVQLGTLSGSVGDARLLERLARSMPDALVLRDGRAGLLERDAPRVLREILLARGELRLEALAAAYNAAAFPECQRGVGKVRQWVLGDPAAERKGPGVYGLKAGYQAELFAGAPSARQVTSDG
ncbi:MAG: hypothetical protein IKQ55_07080 [Kiritimatiellae bacterium]|nr:hypothetical protein [Kiritimatiellia bacterium]